MNLDDIKDKIPQRQYNVLLPEIEKLRPSQEKAIKAGLLDKKNILVCTPTASGKTLIAELAMMKAILQKQQKAIYIVPLKALATEKHKDFKKRYGSFANIALSIGDLDSADSYLSTYDIIVCTSEKLDSLIRHHAPWLSQVGVIVVDEIHLLNDPGRGPTLEIIITMMRQMKEDIHLVGLSATIGNPKELARWMGANLVIDDWRPVKLEEGIYYKEKIELKND